MSLDHLTELQESLRSGASEDDFSHWWRLVEKITADVEGDPGASKHDRDALDRLRSGVSGFIRDLRDGVPSPDSHRARVAATALHSSIAKRTTGPDGWPLR